MTPEQAIPSFEKEGKEVFIPKSESGCKGASPMTPEQVSALSDAELNRAMIWLYPPANRPYDHFEDYGWRCCSGAYEDYIEYDYLTDYNQTMPLVKEHMITLSHYKNVTNACDFILGIEAFSMKSPLRAACECLVLIALDKNKPTTQTPPQID